MNGKKLFKNGIRFILTVFLGILATAFNLHASIRPGVVPEMLKMEIDLINSLFAIATAGITIVYIFFQIQKIRKELNKDD